MKGDAKPLVKFLEGADNRFIIPVYQRNYDWKHDNCKQLFNYTPPLQLVRYNVRYSANKFEVYTVYIRSILGVYSEL